MKLGVFGGGVGVTTLVTVTVNFLTLMMKGEGVLWRGEGDDGRGEGLMLRLGDMWWE